MIMRQTIRICRFRNILKQALELLCDVANVLSMFDKGTQKTFVEK